MTADERMAAARASGPPAPGERPSIAPAGRLGSLLVSSGQTAVGADGRLIAEGRVGAEIDLAEARRCAWQCTLNVLDAVRADVGGLERIASTVRLTVYVAGVPEFTDQHLVADAATECLLRVLGPEVGRHARAAIGVAALPTGSPVEVEAVFELA
ncbi:RidA family protein [Actinomadura viridis]|uniref:Enamine deaminase RidA (YjgF/YER057c/UK114 family) n=1 Tax=Actinomadura viridis TaxID=58110 RepID=A0A931GQQ0_9ACTN|nr:RidA family protein [Actinomadura viridis]MBG6088789.1 enamine deaminase RidA (YjgF/YER057c/UK114 family) [Actinomadura viridis]